MLRCRRELPPTFLCPTFITAHAVRVRCLVHITLARLGAAALILAAARAAQICTTRGETGEPCLPHLGQIGHSGYMTAYSLGALPSHARHVTTGLTSAAADAGSLSRRVAARLAGHGELRAADAFASSVAQSCATLQ